MPDDLSADIAAIARIDAVPAILEVVCRTTGMGFSAVARVTEDRWIACAVRDEIAFGLTPGGELPVATTICDEIRDSGTVVAIDHVATDARFCQHHTPRMYGFQSYISMPIFRTDGQFFGTLCAIDPKPAHVNNPVIIEMFRLFGQLIALHLDALDRLTAGEVALREERRRAELREQFIAVLGHDLRSPLASIGAAAALLSQRSPDARTTTTATTVQRSVARMADLISNILDFARGRLGGGVPVTRVAGVDLAPTLQQVVAEQQAVWPDRTISCDFALDRSVTCDRERIGQLFANLLGNALQHGDPASLVKTCARVDDAGFTLTVTNTGPPIPAEAVPHLFQPFSRATARAGREGLGLGLYIASEIARAHDGTLEAVSTPATTRFTFWMLA